MPPLVSVVIPVYNAARHLPQAVDSVLQQSLRDFELFIVDDGSRDDSLAVARELAARDPGRITVLQHPGGINRGVAATRNVAIARARGKYVAFLDADDRWHADKLARQAAFMESRPATGLTITKANILRDENSHSFIPGTDVLGGLPARNHRRALIQVITCQLNYIFSTVMARADCLKAVGGFDEHLPYQSEDRILVAMVSADHDLGLVPDVLCDYMAHGESYTAGVIHHGLAGLIFFDLQIRVVKWLRRKGRRDWARNIAHRFLPDSFVGALIEARSLSVVIRVMRRWLSVAAMYPSALPLFAWNAIRHSRLGPWLGAHRKKPTR